MTELESVREFENFDLRSPFRNCLRVARDVAVESERFFRAVRGGGLWGPTLSGFECRFQALLLKSHSS